MTLLRRRGHRRNPVSPTCHCLPLPSGSDSTGTHREAAMTSTTLTGERADLLETLAAHRHFLRHTVRGLTDDQARQRTTASELTLGGLVKHVAETESGWADFIVNGPETMGGGADWSEPTPELIESYKAGFQLLPNETLEG